MWCNCTFNLKKESHDLLSESKKNNSYNIFKILEIVKMISWKKTILFFNTQKNYFFIIRLHVIVKIPFWLVFYLKKKKQLEIYWHFSVIIFINNFTALCTNGGACLFCNTRHVPVCEGKGLTCPCLWSVACVSCLRPDGPLTVCSSSWLSPAFSPVLTPSSWLELWNL